MNLLFGIIFGVRTPGLCFSMKSFLRLIRIIIYQISQDEFYKYLLEIKNIFFYLYVINFPTTNLLTNIRLINSSINLAPIREPLFFLIKSIPRLLIIVQLFIVRLFWGQLSEAPNRYRRRLGSIKKGYLQPQKR